MLDAYGRARLETALIAPVITRIAGRVTPNSITMIAGLLGIMVPVALYAQHTSLAVACLWASGYCDLLDGSLARVSDRCSEFGCVLDIVTDRVVEAMVVLGLWCVDTGARSLVCLCLLSSILLCVTSFLVVGIFSDNQGNKSFHYSPGLMERAEAFIFFTLMMLLPEFFNAIGAVCCVLVCYTALRRLYDFKRYVMLRVD